MVEYNRYTFQGLFLKEKWILEFVIIPINLPVYQGVHLPMINLDVVNIP